MPGYDQSHVTTNAVELPSGTALDIGTINANEAVVRDSSTNLTGVAPSTAGNAFVSNGTAWVSQAQYASGTDWARPAAVAAVPGPVGQIYRATDSEVLYYCASTTEWRVASADFGSDKASLGPFSGSIVSANGFAGTAGAAPTFRSGACLFLPGAGTPTGQETLFYRGPTTGAGRGMSLWTGRLAGDRFQLEMKSIVNGVFWAPAGATYAGHLSAIHCISWTWIASSGDVHVSFDGAAPAVVNCPYANPIATDYFAWGIDLSAGSLVLASGDLVAMASYSTEVSDANLQVLSGAASGPAPADFSCLTTYRLPSVTGTLDWQWNANSLRPGITAFQIGADIYRVGNWANPVVLGAIGKTAR